MKKGIRKVRKPARRLRAPQLNKKRALLFGVAHYAKKRPEARPLGGMQLVDKDNLGAVEDVRTFAELLQGEGFSTACYVEPQDTTRDAIVQKLDTFFGTAPRDGQLVLYFSGHAARVPARSSNRQVAPGALLHPRTGKPYEYKTEVLAPSDTDWQARYVTAQDLMSRAAYAKELHASLEVVLETCSASGIETAEFVETYCGPRPRLPANSTGLDPAKGLLGALPIQPKPTATFADLWSPTMMDVMQDLARRMLSGSCVFWGAAMTNTSSYTGPEHPDDRGEVQGLFTRYFIEGYRQGKSRRELRNHIETRIHDYKERHESWHAGNGGASNCMPTDQQPYVDYLGADEALAIRRPITGFY